MTIKLELLDMRIFFLLIMVFCGCSIYAEIEQDSVLQPLRPEENKYSIKNLPKAVGKSNKKSPKEYVPGDFYYSRGKFDAHGNNHSQSSADPSSYGGFVAENDLSQNSKNPTHRELIGKEHEILRNRMLDGGTSRLITPNSPNPPDSPLSKILKPKMLDIILPSFKTKIDL